MRRILLTVAALTIPVSAVTLAFGNPASAKTKPETKITCKTLSGTIASIVAGGCNGNTGGSSEPISGTALASGGTITWVNGKTTTIAAPTLNTVKNSKCKGTAETFSATVTHDTTGLTSLGTATGEVCVASSSITALKPLVTT